MRAAPRGNKQLVAARTGTGRFFQSRRLGADPRAGPGRFLQQRPLPPPAARAPAGDTGNSAGDDTRGRLPSSARSGRHAKPPPLCRLLTPPTAIPRLGIVGLEELLAAFQQAATPPRPPTRALPRRRSSIMLKRTQGSANSRRSSLGEEPHSSPRRLIPAALSLGLPPHQANHPAPGRHFLAGQPPPTTADHPLRWSAKWLNPRPPLTRKSPRNRFTPAGGDGGSYR